MKNLTHKDYIGYLASRLKAIDINALSKEERHNYDLMIQDLQKAEQLPQYMLKSSLLTTKENLDEETLQSLALIENTSANTKTRFPRERQLAGKISVRSNKIAMLFRHTVIRIIGIISVISIILFLLWNIGLFPIEMTGSEMTGSAGSGTSTPLSIFFSLSFLAALILIFIILSYPRNKKK